MQPTLAITVPAPGMIFINGRFLGEAAPDAPLIAPVHSFGAVYLEYRPLEPGWLSIARKLVLSAGKPLSDVLAEDVFAVCWPGGVTEVELAPPQRREDAAEALTLDGLNCRIVRSEHSRIELNGLSCPFPENGQSPELRRSNGCIALMGAAGDGRYLLTFSPDLTRQTGSLQADRLEFESDSLLKATSLRRDVAGHATLERWQVDASGLRLISSEPVWEDGAPRAPSTPEEAARAAAEAALLGRFDEADSHLSPALRARRPLDLIGELCALCLPMKYSPPTGRPCVGLLHVDSGSCATVIPMYYQAEQTGGRGLLTALSIEAQ